MTYIVAHCVAHLTVVMDLKRGDRSNHFPRNFPSSSQPNVGRLTASLCFLPRPSAFSVAALVFWHSVPKSLIFPSLHSATMLHVPLLLTPLSFSINMCPEVCSMIYSNLPWGCGWCHKKQYSRRELWNYNKAKEIIYNLLQCSRRWYW